MNIVLWIPIGLVSAAVMMIASRSAVKNSSSLARTLRIPPFLVGVTLVALGTDAPELVNSLVSCYLGHGDINLGDSIGSVFTQATLVLGLFPFIVGAGLAVPRREVVGLPALTVAVLALGVSLYGDGEFTRRDALVLASAWVAAMLVLVAWKLVGPVEPGDIQAAPGRSALGQALRALGAFAIVGVAAATLVQAVAALSEGLGVPEYVLSFFGASVATSLPELATEFTALRRGQSQLALGDVLGSCLVDASLSVSLGPLFFPGPVDGSLAVSGSVLAAGAMLLVALLLGARGRLDRITGSILALVYLAGYFLVGVQ